MNCSCLVSGQWLVTDAGEQISKSRAEDERAAFAEVRGRLEIAAVYVVQVSAEAFSVISTLICMSSSNKQVSKHFSLVFSFWIKLRNARWAHSPLKRWWVDTCLSCLGGGCAPCPERHSAWAAGWRSLGHTPLVGGEWPPGCPTAGCGGQEGWGTTQPIFAHSQIRTAACPPIIITVCYACVHMYEKFCTSHVDIYCCTSHIHIRGRMMVIRSSVFMSGFPSAEATNIE